jgi:hypothetical protein
VKQQTNKELDKRGMVLPEIKTLGTYEVQVKLHPQVRPAPVPPGSDGLRTRVPSGLTAACAHTHASQVTAKFQLIVAKL